MRNCDATQSLEEPAQKSPAAEIDAQYGRKFFHVKFSTKTLNTDHYLRQTT